MTASHNKEPTIDRLGREAFINLFLAAGRFTDEVEATCRVEGLTMSHYTVLWVVCLSDGSADSSRRCDAPRRPTQERWVRHAS